MVAAEERRMREQKKHRGGAQKVEDENKTVAH